MHRKILLLSVAIAVIAGSILAANITFTAAAATTAAATSRSAGSPYMYSQSRERYSFNNNPSGQATTSLTNGWNQMLTFGRNLFTHGNYRFSQWGQGMSGNVTITSVQAKSTVEADIPNLKVGTPTSFRLSWIVPIEDGKGIVTMIRVSHVTANTTEQAATVVSNSLAKGWTAGTPKLVRTLYYVPLIDSSNKTISYVRVDGRSGSIVMLTSSSPTLTVTSAQAKTIVSNAIKNFTVGDVKERVGSWIVSIKDGDKTVMTVILGKINTPKSEDAVNAVKNSLEKGWTAGEPKQHRSVYNVPIIDSNGDTISIIRVNGRTGDILGFPSMYRVGVTRSV
ncbi:MAG: hypothetical protein M1503_07555 [Thaumarchaeota archaeon]|nr:hypothetical protein [Nitrososphaerota archaeon]MCL5318098.1 hypothetical protein [Nitrososphaerota archaeon]